MGLFGKVRGNSGGFMNVIRCDEKEYLVWKWKPDGQEDNSTTRENSIRYGSSLRVKDGEVAVFLYKQRNGTVQDYIEGPWDETIRTANFPVLASIVGSAFGGESPFQAEVYFINMALNIQINFGVPYFEIFDPNPNFAYLGVPVAVRGTITFNVTDYRDFIKLNRLRTFDLDDFRDHIKSSVIRFVKGSIVNLPKILNKPVLQIEQEIEKINETIGESLKPRLEELFGVTLRAVDIRAIEFDKSSKNYTTLYHLTVENTTRTMDEQTSVNIKNLKDTQRINTENIEESLKVQREEAQRAQRLQTEQNFMGAHALDQQTEVLKTGAQSLGQMGAMNIGGGDGFNPAGMMTGMMVGGAIGQQMSGMMNNMGQQMQTGMNTPPPIPNVQYFVAVNGQQTGPFTIQQLQQYAMNGQFTPQSYVWKQGMAQWEYASAVPELASLFSAPTPPPPPMP